MFVTGKKLLQKTNYLFVVEQGVHEEQENIEPVAALNLRLLVLRLHARQVHGHLQGGDGFVLVAAMQARATFQQVVLRVLSYLQ